MNCEKLCIEIMFPFGHFRQINVNNFEILPTLTWNWCSIMLYDEIKFSMH